MRNHLALRQSDVRPRLAGIGGLVQPVAHCKVRSNDSGAGADVNDVRIARCHGNRADGPRGLLVEDRLPVRAVVGGAPDTAVIEAGVSNVGLRGRPGDGTRTSSARWTDSTPVHGRGDVQNLRGQCGVGGEYSGQ